jgi:hypothetical protein
VVTATISQASTEYVRVPVFAAENGEPIDLATFATVEMAFTTAYAAPTVWQAASWDTTQVGTYVAQCLVGPNGGATTLAVGTYYAWVRITCTPETVVEPAGEVRVV